MSKELAEELDLDLAAEETKEKIEELRQRDTTPDMSKEELNERIRSIRDGEYVPQKANSWRELWDRVNSE